MKNPNRTSVVDPWHVGTDPDPRVRTTDLRIRILLFTSVMFKMPTKKYFLSFLLIFEGTFTSIFKEKSQDKKKLIKQYKRNQGRAYFFA